MNISPETWESVSVMFAGWTREDWECRDRCKRLAIERKAAKNAAKTGDDNTYEVQSRKRAQELANFVESAGDDDVIARANRSYLTLMEAWTNKNTAREHFRIEVQEHNKRLIKARHNLTTMIDYNRASEVYQQWKRDLAIIEDLYNQAYNDFRDASKPIGNPYD